ncbi:MAG: transcriptional regulator [Gemmatimonadetes bacterium]|nr:transcriptional regulator [Gemmatimonadota bacterium]MYC71607.1 transcriptional regulator [Gemmatimonadota bacterium]MYI63956.1 transcriptional regulator [Gemmatimonadota bacterium]
MSENQNIEWKETWRDEYLKWICGFANAQGGVLEIGKNDRGEVVGVKDVLRLLEDIPNKAQALLGVVVDVNLKSEDGGEYLEVAVDPYPNPISYKGEFYYRSGSTKQVLRGAALSRFLLQKYGRTWDDVPLPGVGLKDLDGRVFDGFRQRGASSERLPQDILDESDEGVIERLQLREAGFLKRAAVLLFHPAPDRFVMEAYVKIGYFRGSELLYQDVIEGDLFTQVDRTMDLLYTKYTRALISYDGVYRVETFPVPREAMREAVINAIIHRDYASPTTIQISVYDDRIAIWNAVQLPSEWAADQLAGGLSSKPYNPRIAYAFFRAGMIEAWGRGIRRIAEMCKEAGNPVPEWKLQSSGDGLWLRFPFSAAYLDKAREHIGEPESLVEPQLDQDQAGVQAGVQARVQAGVQATLSVRDVAMLQACVQRAATSKELRAAASYSGRTKNFRMWLERLLQEELLEMTVPDKPRSPLQRYRLTDKGRAALASLKSGGTQT